MNTNGKLKKCRLCRKEFETLIESHLIPRSAYGSMDEEEIVIVNGPSNEIFSSKKQIKAHFLCIDCEEKFNSNGERETSKLWAKNGVFRLLESFESRKRVTATGEIDLSLNSDLDLKTLNYLFYFACSIFWRANEWPQDDKKLDRKIKWPKFKNPYRGSLGPYVEPFRQYLYEGKALEKVRIIAELNPSEKYQSSIVFPMFIKNGTVRLHYFAVPGITFCMLVGESAKIIPTQLLTSGSNMLVITQQQAGYYFMKPIKDVLNTADFSSNLKIKEFF